MKLLVTGGAGFIGSHLCQRLLGRGDEVTILDNFNDYYDPALKRLNAQRLDGARIVEGDIRDRDTVKRLFWEGGFEGVVHLAAMAGVRNSLMDPLLYCDVNVHGTQVLLNELIRRPEVRFVFGSSSSVYGTNESVPFREVDDIHKPVSPYAATKRAGELLCYTHHHLYGNPIACLRFFTVYGPRQRPEMAIHKFTRHITQGKPIPFFGDGSSRRDYTYIDDIVDGVIRSLDRNRAYAIYNLGNSDTISLADLVSLIAEVTGCEPVLDRRPNQPGDVPVTYADVTKAREELGYDPRTPVQVGVQKFFEWYQGAAVKP